VLDWPGESGRSGHADHGVDCGISWYGAAGSPDQEGSEATVQAMSGLMYLHGRDLGGPRRIGVEIASVAAGVLAAQALLAAVIGRRRGRPTAAVRTSVLQAGLLQASHYFAAATCAEEWLPAPPAADPGPPFRTSDGHWFEIETLDTDAWRAFSVQLGAEGANLGRGWTLFRPRYYRGTTSLPPGFHEATAAHTLDRVREVARACGVSLCRIRSYDDVLADLGRSDGNPVIEGLVPVHPAEVTQVPAPAISAVPDELPLAGIEVVEATNRLQGPLAGLLLQMLGAHVTRVEPPGGDLGRGVPPVAGDTGSFFLTFNRQKSTVELDLSAAAGRAELAELVGGADVFLHNWRPGKARAWGLEPEDLARRNPGLVYTEASGWGNVQGTSHLVGTDFLVQAYAGLGHGLNPEPGPPLPSRVLLTDFMGALITCEGVLAGLYRREQSDGHGCRVRTSLLAGAMALQAHIADGVAEGSEHGRRAGRPVWGALDVPIQAADGQIAMSVVDDDAFERLCKTCGVDPHGAPRPATEAAVATRIQTGSMASWEKLLSEAGIPCAAVATDLSAIPSGPRLSPLFEPLAGSCRAPATPWEFWPQSAAARRSSGGDQP
jgi:crotonobetainyl-CoA:carnitine CoA-transferase CaiB-like acyl-CoA transferase